MTPQPPRANDIFHAVRNPTLKYRVLPGGGPGLRWNQILTGLGAFLGNKKIGRYHGSRQRTVYAASDPLVAITAAAFYEALNVQQRIGTTMLPQAHRLPPLTATSFRLWAFRLDPPPTVIDLEDSGAHPIFHHPPFVLRNPTSNDYRPTQDLMDAVFNLPANAAGQKAWGVKIPSARTPRISLPSPSQWFYPFHYAFIVPPLQQRLPATQLDSWDLEVEFFDQDTQAPLTAHSILVDWQRNWKCCVYRRQYPASRPARGRKARVSTGRKPTDACPWDDCPLSRGVSRQQEVSRQQGCHDNCRHTSVVTL